MILLQIPLEPHEITVDDDLKEGAKQVEVRFMLHIMNADGARTHAYLLNQLFAGMEMQEKMKMKNEGSLDVGMLQQYAIVDGEVDFDGALASGGKIPSGGVVSVKSNKTKAEKQVKKKEKEQSSRKRSKDDGFKSNKKKKA